MLFCYLIDRTGLHVTVEGKTPQMPTVLRRLNRLRAKCAVVWWQHHFAWFCFSLLVSSHESTISGFVHLVMVLSLLDAVIKLCLQLHAQHIELSLLSLHELLVPQFFLLFVTLLPLCFFLLLC